MPSKSIQANYKILMEKILFSVVLSFLMLLVSFTQATAIPITIPSTPSSVSFYIPLKSSSSGSYSSGYGHSADTVKLNPGQQSSGWLDLSLVFGPIPSTPISTADLFLSFSDLDLLPYNVASVLFLETAELKSGSTSIGTLNESYAIANSINPTNNSQINLMFNIVPTVFTSLDDPFVLDLTLRTELTNNGHKSITLRNTKESILAATLEISDAPAPVPEPSTMILLGSGLVGLVVFRKKLRS